MCGESLLEMSLQGKIVIVTGSNAGIGKETVRALAKDGAKVYMASRSKDKCEEAKAELLKENSGADIHCRELDLGDFESIRKFVKEFLEVEHHLHILINNAGIVYPKRVLTKQGLEGQFGNSVPSRIVVVSSFGHKMGTINFDDLNCEKSYSSGAAYSQSKLANILFTRELARRLQGTSVTINALHPGAVNTQMSNSHWLFSNPISKLFMKNPKEGAATTLFVATSSKLEGVTGKYYSDCKEAGVSSKAKDDTLAAKLWAVSEEIVAKHTDL